MKHDDDVIDEATAAQLRDSRYMSPHDFAAVMCTAGTELQALGAWLKDMDTDKDPPLEMSTSGASAVLALVLLCESMGQPLPPPVASTLEELARSTYNAAASGVAAERASRGRG